MADAFRSVRKGGKLSVTVFWRVPEGLLEFDGTPQINIYDSAGAGVTDLTDVNLVDFTSGEATELHATYTIDAADADLVEGATYYLEFDAPVTHTKNSQSHTSNALTTVKVQVTARKR